MCLVIQLCLTLCNPMDLEPVRLLCPWGFSRLDYWNGLPCPPLGDLPNPGIKSRSLALQADSLPPKPPEKPMNTGMSSLALLQRFFLTQESKGSFLNWRQILYQLSYQGNPDKLNCYRKQTNKYTHKHTHKQQNSPKWKTPEAETDGYHYKEEKNQFSSLLLLNFHNTLFKILKPHTIKGKILDF